MKACWRAHARVHDACHTQTHAHTYTRHMHARAHLMAKDAVYRLEPSRQPLPLDSPRCFSTSSSMACALPGPRCHCGSLPLPLLPQLSLPSPLLRPSLLLLLLLLPWQLELLPLAARVAEPSAPSPSSWVLLSALCSTARPAPSNTPHCTPQCAHSSCTQGAPLPSSSDVDAPNGEPCASGCCICWKCGCVSSSDPAVCRAAGAGVGVAACVPDAAGEGGLLPLLLGLLPLAWLWAAVAQVATAGMEMLHSMGSCCCCCCCCCCSCCCCCCCCCCLSDSCKQGLSAPPLQLWSLDLLPATGLLLLLLLLLLRRRHCCRGCFVCCIVWCCCRCWCVCCR